MPKKKLHNPTDNARKDSRFKLIFSLSVLAMSLILAVTFLLSDSPEGNRVLPWLIIPVFLLFGISGTYTSIQELRGKYDDPDSWETPKWMENDVYRPEHCYRQKVNGYYLLRPTTTPGCAGRTLLWISAILAAGVTALFAGEEDFRDGIDTGAELFFVIGWYLLPLVFLILGLRFYIEGRLGSVSALVSRPAFPGQEVEVILFCKTRYPVQTFAAEVICQEEATYEKGSSSETKREIIEQMTLCNIGIRQPTESGEFCRRTFAVPPDAMLSFKSRHNEIEWYFRVTIDFPSWRNFSQDIPFRVLSPQMFEQEERKWPR